MQEKLRLGVRVCAYVCVCVLDIREHLNYAACVSVHVHSHACPCTSKSNECRVLAEVLLAHLKSIKRK